MDSFSRADLNALLTSPAGPCVSIFTATRRGGGEDDRPRWQEQLHEAKRQLGQLGMTPEAIGALLSTTHAYLTRHEEEFWSHTSDGLATFLAPNMLRLFRLPIPLTDRVVVGPRFHVRPLLKFVADDGRFFVLALSQNRVRLLEATAHSVRRVEVPAMPSTMAESRRTHDRDEPLNLHTHAAGGGTAMQAVFHGQGVGIDDQKTELLRFFQDIDRAVLPVLGEGNAPLVLATVEYMAAIYRRANRYEHLHGEIIKGNPDRVSDKKLHERALALIAPAFRAHAERAVAQFRQLAGTGRTVTQSAELLPAAKRGEIETLLVSDGAETWGRFDPDSNRVEELTAYEPGAEELGNLAASFALIRGRNVHIVSAADGFEGALAGMYFVPMNKHGK